MWVLFNLLYGSMLRVMKILMAGLMCLGRVFEKRFTTRSKAASDIKTILRAERYAIKEALITSLGTADTVLRYTST